MPFDADFSAQWSLLASMQTETIASAAAEAHNGRETDRPGVTAGTDAGADADAECESDGEAETDSDRLDFPDFGLDTDMSVWIS
ncbi:hypothetical protein DN536_34760, partial [Burkholderia multivorans]